MPPGGGIREDFRTKKKGQRVTYQPLTIKYNINQIIILGANAIKSLAFVGALLVYRVNIIVLSIFPFRTSYNTVLVITFLFESLAC